jgi:hypothetical protein
LEAGHDMEFIWGKGFRRHGATIGETSRSVLWGLHPIAMVMNVEPKPSRSGREHNQAMVETRLQMVEAENGY